jgi:hypothetical protein
MKELLARKVENCLEIPVKFQRNIAVNVEYRIKLAANEVDGEYASDFIIISPGYCLTCHLMNSAAAEGGKSFLFHCHALYFVGLANYEKTQLAERSSHYEKKSCSIFLLVSSRHDGNRDRRLRQLKHETRCWR